MCQDTYVDPSHSRPNVPKEEGSILKMLTTFCTSKIYILVSMCKNGLNFNKRVLYEKKNFFYCKVLYPYLLKVLMYVPLFCDKNLVFCCCFLIT